MTGHISPYVNGLAPETRTFVAEAERHGIGVKFVATANRIEATGDIQGAAGDRTTMAVGFSAALSRPAILMVKTGCYSAAIRSSESTPQARKNESWNG
jgi:hypothetical protein